MSKKDKKQKAGEDKPASVKSGDLALYGGVPVRRDMPEQRVVTGEDEIKQVVRVVRSGRLTSLSHGVVEKFEKKFAAWCGVKYAVAVNSGTAALHVALAALDIGPGDEVIVPPYTFIATASAVIQQNAVPVFADIDPATLNISPEAVAAKITPRTKAIVPVHLFGLPADMAAINEVAGKHGIPVIEDACQAHGAAYHGDRAGALGRMACFSFQESKNMAAGEGGMITTNDKQLARQCRIIRHIGMAAKYEYVTLGYNYRMPALSAAVGLAQLKKLKAFNRHRAALAEFYAKKLADLPVTLYPAPESVTSANHLFPVTFPRELVPDREFMLLLVRALHAENAPVWWVYPAPLNQVQFIREQTAYARQCPFACPLREEPAAYDAHECPAAEDIAGRTLVLPTAPCYPLSVARDTVAALRKVTAYFSG